tara:strand:+ start:26564 stop:28252 length:1689 start_codon:yes stop_codon:yes gene_type:complete
MNLIVFNNQFILSLFLKLFYLATLISSYILGLLFYDSSTGLDWNKYFPTVEYFLGSGEVIYDSSSPLYFYMISQNIKFQSSLLGPYNSEIIFNNSVQSMNFLLYIIGCFGIFNLLKRRKVGVNKSLFILSILNFLPTTYYLRLTMKPEILAFALFPWALFSLNKYFKEKSTINIVSSVLLLSLLLTIKLSITGMILFCLVFLYKKELLNIPEHIKLIFLVFFVSLIIIYENFLVTNLWLFERPQVLSETLIGLWDYRAPKEFFYTVDINKLAFDPYKHIHANSFFSILLLDTVGDYFGWFWNHYENSNYLAYNKIQFTDNFLIQTFSTQYISIIFTIFFYMAIIYFYLKKEGNNDYLLMPLFGILILAINSLGFPTKNFNPETADLFKVHYYSFLVCFSFSFLIAKLISIRKIFYLISLLLIPLFIFVIGFPKDLDQTTKDELVVKFEHSEFCKILTVVSEDADCRDSFKAVCTTEYFGIPKSSFDEDLIKNNKHFPIELQKGGNVRKVTSEIKCKELINSGYEYKNSLRAQIYEPKKINFSLGLFFLLIFLQVSYLYEKRR